MFVMIDISFNYLNNFFMRPRTKTASNTLITAMIISKNNVILISYELTNPLVMSGTRINAELAAMLT